MTFLVAAEIFVLTLIKFLIALSPNSLVFSKMLLDFDIICLKSLLKLALFDVQA